MFEGSYVALITPMTDAGELDETALRHLVNWHVDNATHGLVPVGTTGESPTLSGDEHRRVLELVIEESNGRLPVIAGCGSNSTREALAFHDHAKQLGADAALHVTGYYNRPSQKGIVEHFKAINASSELPIIVYNIPPRAVVDIIPETMAELAALEFVLGVKDATRDLARPGLERLLIKKPFSYFSGEDGTAVAYNAAGGMGCISVTANVAPQLCSAMQTACKHGDFKNAQRIQQQLMPLHQALALEPSPAGIKYACSQLELCTPKARLPIITLSDCTKKKIDAALQQLNLLH